LLVPLRWSKAPSAASNDNAMLYLEGIYCLPTDRPRNRGPRVFRQRYHSVSSIHQMPHASSSIMPIPITSTASATGS